MLMLPPRPKGWSPDRTATGPARACPHCMGAGAIIERLDTAGTTPVGWLIPVWCETCKGRGWR